MTGSSSILNFLSVPCRHHLSRMHYMWFEHPPNWYKAINFSRRCSFDFCRCYTHSDNRLAINEEHPQKLLNLTSEEVPLPEGFLGYAVNLLHLNKKFVLTMDIDGHGLRETLFFQLFSYLQVYATKSHMKNALQYIKTAAVSLDGGMVIYDKDLRDVELGCRYWFFFF